MTTSFNSATARSRGETARTDSRSAEAAMASIRPRHGAVEKPDMHSATATHVRRRFNSATDGAVEKPRRRLTHGETWYGFNSATARSRGETPARRRLMHGDVSTLQFGHGTEPWRNADCSATAAGSGHVLQFGHGTEPWRNHALDEPTQPESTTLQFGHGRSRGETAGVDRLARQAHASFNSATARSRGETRRYVGRTCRECPSFNSATARSRGETTSPRAQSVT